MQTKYFQQKALYTLCIIVLLLFVNAIADAQSAIRQLEIISGQTIDRGSLNKYSYDGQENQTQQMTAEDYNREYSTFLTEQAHEENEKGIAAYMKGDWNKAARHFRAASKFRPTDKVILENYQSACYKADLQKEEQRRQKEILEKEKQVQAQQKQEQKVYQTVVKTADKDKKYYNAQLRKLEKESYHIKVPPLTPTKTIHEGIMLGLFNTQEKNALTDTTIKLTSPFSGKAYKTDEYFATSDNLTAKELLRGVMDNSYLGQYTLNTEHGRKLVEKLNGTHFNRLIAHSNGATVSEALIRNGNITVDELNIVGGDRSYINFVGLNELVATGKVKRIVVWVNPGDVIPIGSSAGLISPLPGARDQYYNAAVSYMKTMFSAEEHNTAGVEYRFMSGNDYEGQSISMDKDFFKAHGLDAYLRNMNRFFKKK